jgi:hypothetical protein
MWIADGITLLLDCHYVDVIVRMNMLTRSDWFTGQLRVPVRDHSVGVVFVEALRSVARGWLKTASQGLSWQTG